MARTRGQLVQKVHRIEFHRNGVGGASFYAVTFTGKGWDGEGTAELVAAVFQAEGHVAVLSYSDPRGGINPAERWRGDNFERELRAAIEAHEDDDEPLGDSGHRDPEETGEPCPACGEEPSPAELGEHAAARENGFPPEFEAVNS